MVPEGAEIVPNPNGTAPGLWLEHEDRIIVLLPGPPRELKPMIEALARERLAPRAGTSRVFSARHPHRRPDRIARGRDGAAVLSPAGAARRATSTRRRSRLPADRLSPDHAQHRPGSGSAAIDAAARELRTLRRGRLQPAAGSAWSRSWATLLRQRVYTVAAAESCTGGLLTSRLTDVPGSSALRRSAVVAYSNEAKTALLGVPPALIAAHGAVSEPVALAMAAGIKARAGSTIGVGITGIAGPDGGTPEKPVGTVAIALDGPWGAPGPHALAPRRPRAHQVLGDAGRARRRPPHAAAGAGSNQ